MRRNLFSPMTSAERARRRRARLRKAGLCEHCGLIPPASHAQSCEACLGEYRDRYYVRAHHGR